VNRIDHQRRAADHQRADDFGKRDTFTQHGPAEQNRGDRYEQRHQHDIGRARAPRLKKHV
jgi:hypothetical protein